MLRGRQEGDHASLGPSKGPVKADFWDNFKIVFAWFLEGFTHNRQPDDQLHPKFLAALFCDCRKNRSI
jgi:hypothetical protein